MTFNILWPGMRWDDARQIEIDSVADGGKAVLYDAEAEVPDDSYRQADAIVSVVDIPEHRRPLLERCRIFVTPKVGFDNIDIEAWGALGIPVSNIPDYGTQEVADHALALMLSLVRCIPMHHRRLAADPVANWVPRHNPLARRLSRSVCGIVGLGRIGTALALRAKTLGMDVVFYDPYKPNGSDLALNVRRAESLAELFAQSDVVSIHVPLEDGTRNLIDAEVLAHAKQDLILINSARGPIVDIDALHDAMKSGRVGAAGLDVLPEEPPNLDRPLVRAWADREEWLLDRLLITPHSAFSTPESVHDMRSKPAEVALKYLKTGQLDNCVNQQFLVGPAH
ncbi:MAG: C-terminal binding protein [Actinomycetia bacterium]|nr:C-terminal binding protein [Actinomycetes bacterium]